MQNKTLQILKSIKFAPLARLILTTFLVFSSSSYNKNKIYNRNIASVQDKSCKTISNQVASQSTHQYLLERIGEIKTYDDIVSLMVADLNFTTQEIQFKIAFSNLAFASLKITDLFKENSYQFTHNFKNILEVYKFALEQKVTRINSEKEIKELFHTLEEKKFPSDFQKDLFQKSLFFLNNQKEIILKTNWSLNELDRIIYDSLESKILKISEPKEFSKIIESIDELSLDNKRIISFITKSSYFENTLSNEHPTLSQSILNLSKDGNRFDSLFIKRNIDNTLKYTLQGLSISELPEINSAYLFFQIIQNEQYDVKTLSVLKNSSYAKRMSFTETEIENFLRIDKGKNFEYELQGIFQIFKNKKNMNSLDTYDQDINISGIKNQCFSGACWNHTSTSEIEIKISQEFGDIDISEDYTYIKHIQNQYRLKILDNSYKKESYLDNLEGTDNFISEGGSAHVFQMLSRIVGLLPKSVWTPRKIFGAKESQAFKQKMLILFKEFKNQLNQEDIADSSISKIQIKYLNLINDSIGNYFGEPPSTFKYKGKLFDNMSFMKKYYPNYQKERVYYQNSTLSGPSKYYISRYPYVVNNKIMDFKAISHFKASKLNEIEQMILNNLDNSNSVRARFIWDKKYINDETGRISIPDGETPEILKNALHSVIIAGYDLDKNGNIKTLKILNSYGEDAGDGGIYHMDYSYFKEMIINISPEDSEYQLI